MLRCGAVCRLHRTASKTYVSQFQRIAVVPFSPSMHPSMYIIYSMRSDSDLSHIKWSTINFDYCILLNWPAQTCYSNEITKWTICLLKQESNANMQFPVWLNTRAPLLPKCPQYNSNYAFNTPMFRHRCTEIKQKMKKRSQCCSQASSGSASILFVGCW